MSREHRVANLTGTPLEQFTPGQSLYIARTAGGFSWSLLCEFVALKGKNVQVRVVAGDPQHSPHCPFPRGVAPGTVLNVVRKSTYLWGQAPGERERCHWYNGKEGWR